MNFLKSITLALFLSISLSATLIPSIPCTAQVAAAEADAKAEADVPGFLQNISVTIRAGFSEGSGVAYNRGDVTYIWTAAHVVDGLRTTRMVVDPKTGTPRTLVEFKDAKVVKTLIEDGRTVGRLEMDAEVIRYSDADNGEDLALLRVRKKGFIKTTAKFHLDKSIPKLGTRLLHVGSLLGQQGSNSMTTGIMSQHGRLIGKTVYDQTTVTAFPGSSGGGVYLEDGQYIGMLVRGAGEGFNLIVPARRMLSWAKRAGIEWAMNPKVKMPSEEDMRKLPIEDVGARFSSGKSGDAGKKALVPMKFPYHIQKLSPTVRVPTIEQLPSKVEDN